MSNLSILSQLLLTAPFHRLAPLFSIQCTSNLGYNIPVSLPFLALALHATNSARTGPQPTALLLSKFGPATSSRVQHTGHWSTYEFPRRLSEALEGAFYQHVGRGADICSAGCVGLSSPSQPSTGTYALLQASQALLIHGVVTFSYICSLWGVGCVVDSTLRDRSNCTIQLTVVHAFFQHYEQKPHST